MKRSVSGDYTLPGPFDCFVGNSVLRIVRWVPSGITSWLIRGHSNYQVSSDTEVTGYQGVSARKLESMQLPADLRGKSVLDLGCAEGFFSRECAKRGARRVLGVDSSLGRLLYGSVMASKNGLDVKYRMDVFPSSGITGTFDYVLCLSLLHHSLSQKNIWKVLVRGEHVDDAAILRTQLKLLRSMTAQKGKCILEIPYEYDDPVAERRLVDFELMNSELRAAGFTDARCLGTWDFNPNHREFKDRILYVAEG